VQHILSVRLESKTEYSVVAYLAYWNGRLTEFGAFIDKVNVVIILTRRYVVMQPRLLRVLYYSKFQISPIVMSTNSSPGVSVL
jgi:hypothetical protein